MKDRSCALRSVQCLWHSVQYSVFGIQMESEACKHLPCLSFCSFSKKGEYQMQESEVRKQESG